MEKFVIPCRVAVRTKRVCTGETGSGRLLPADVYAHLRLSIYHVPGSMLIYPTQSSRHSVNKQQHPQDTGARRAGAAGPAPQSVRVRAGTPGRWGGVGRGFPGEGRVPGGVREREGRAAWVPEGKAGPRGRATCHQTVGHWVSPAEGEVPVCFLAAGRPRHLGLNKSPKKRLRRRLRSPWFSAEALTN